MAVSALIIGLGNPGSEYEKTRHNVGFMAVDRLRETSGGEAWHLKKNLNAEISETTVQGTQVILAKPTTYMNLSANAVTALMAFYKIPAEKCIVIYDDIDLPTGMMRIRASGSSGTHNGMRSICGAIGTEFPRIRIGIDGRSPEQKQNQELADYVLGKFGKSELPAIEKILTEIPDAVGMIVTGQLEKAMGLYN